MSKIEAYHVIIAMVGVTGWFWGGAHLGLQPDAVEYCRMCAIGVIGSAVGMQYPKSSPGVPAQPQPKEQQL